MIWNELSEIFRKNNTFLISSHLSLDGDCVGSQLAFYWYLMSLGKTVFLYNHDPVPAKFSFLTNQDKISCIQPDQPIDVLIILDCSNPGRLGWDYHKLNGNPIIINIDHHRDNTNFGKLNYIDTAGAATAEIICRYFSSLSIRLPDHVAESLYAAILTDTGGFRFSNTTSQILRTCADLVDQGADCAQIYEQIYASHPQRALMLQSKIWSTLRFHLDGKVCSMEMPMSILDQLGAVYSDSEGMADYTIMASGVEIGILTKYTDKESHFSLRSKGRINVGRIAQMIPGGGGHGSAAGCTVTKPYDQALPYMLEIIRKELN
jgi:bifunctional oligoribonuclease and PAP phosphatase NrnA